MPAMMGNQPTKDDYIKGLESSLVAKMKPLPPRKPPMMGTKTGRPPGSGPLLGRPKDRIIGKNGRPWPGKFGI